MGLRDGEGRVTVRGAGRRGGAVAGFAFEGPRGGWYEQGAERPGALERHVITASFATRSGRVVSAAESESTYDRLRSPGPPSA
jgi:hypothetical protein